MPYTYVVYKMEHYLPEELMRLVWEKVYDDVVDELLSLVWRKVYNDVVDHVRTITHNTTSNSTSDITWSPVHKQRQRCEFRYSQLPQHFCLQSRAMGGGLYLPPQNLWNNDGALCRWMTPINDGFYKKWVCLLGYQNSFYEQHVQNLTKKEKIALIKENKLGWTKKDPHRMSTKQLVRLYMSF